VWLAGPALRGPPRSPRGEQANVRGPPGQGIMLCALLTTANGTVDALRAPSILGADSCTAWWLLVYVASNMSCARVCLCRPDAVGRGQKSSNCAFTQSPCGRPSWTLRLIRRRRAKGGVTVVSAT